MTMKVRALAIAILMMAAMWLVGCGHYTCTKGFGATTCGSSNGSGNGNKGSGNGGTGGTYLFIADAGNVQGETLDTSTGKISVTSNFSPIQLPTNEPGTWMAVANGTYLYSGYPTIGEIYGWLIAQDGTVSFLNSQQPFPASFLIAGFSNGTQAMITNPAGTLLFIADPINEQVHTFQIGTSGGLTETNAVFMPSGFIPYNLAMDGLGAYLYVSNVSNGGVTTEVAGFSVGSDGGLTALPNSPFQMSMQQMQGDSSGKYMIGTTASFFPADDNVYMSTIQSNGVLSAPVAFAAADSPQLVTVQPSQGGVLAYTFDLGGGVEGFQISNGALAPVSGSPFNIPGAMGQFDPSGKFLFVTEESPGSSTNILDVYDVSASSTLTTIFGSVGWSPGAWAVTSTQ